MGTRILEAAAKRAGGFNSLCYGKHCSGEHPLPIPMFHAVLDDFPQHVTYSFHRGIPVPAGAAMSVMELAIAE
jgi:hypothetical protein